MLPGFQQSGMSQQTVKSEKFIPLLVLFGIITTVFTYLPYGGGNYLELLPKVTRALDPSYLQNDFFTNVSADSIARLYYVNFIAFLAGSERNLPFITLILTLSANIAISFVTYCFARDLFNKSDQAGIYAAALIMSVSTFALGWRSTIYWDHLIPATLAVPFILAATWATARKKLLLGMVLIGIASLIHPLFGLEMGAILLLAYVAGHLAGRSAVNRDFWKTFIPGLLLLGIFSLISIIPQLSQPTIDTQHFIHILAYFRTPHHRIPSTFGPARFILAGSFLTAILLLYIRDRKSRDSSINLFIGIMSGVIFALCLGGYLFVELIPTRLWTTAQTFRLLYIMQWFGLILVAGVLADKKLERSTKTLYLVGVLNALALGLVVISHSLREWLEQKNRKISILLDNSLILLIAVAILIYLSLPLLPVFLLGSYVLLIILFTETVGKQRYSALLVGSVLIIMAGIAYAGLPDMGQADSIGRVAENLSLEIKSELGPEADEIAQYARENTPEETIFLTPPTWGQFRLLARRAIVVDFKAFPFTDEGMKEWYNRITDAYGTPRGLGFEMIDELNENYENLNDKTLRALQEKYNFSYAVLPSRSSSNFEVIFQNEEFKIIKFK